MTGAYLSAVKNIVRDALLLVGAAIVATGIVSGAGPLIERAKQFDQVAGAGQQLQPAAISAGKLTPSMQERLERRAERTKNAAAAAGGIAGEKVDPNATADGDGSDDRDAPTTVADAAPKPAPGTTTPKPVKPKAPRGQTPGADERPSTTPSGSDPTSPATVPGAVIGSDATGDGPPPPIPVNVNGEGGWQFSGVNAEGEQVALRSGALQLPGGFDSSTLQGGIGVAMAVKQAPLADLTALSYRYEIARRGGSDEPAIHLTVTGAVPGIDSKLESGQTNFVYRPSVNGITAGNATVDALAPGNRWYATGNVSGGPGSASAPITLQQLAARNPGAKIIQIAIDNGSASGGGASPSAATSIAVDDVTLGLFGRVDRFDFHR